MLPGRIPELGIWAFTERRLPTIDEAFLSLEIQTATAVIERHTLACNRRQGGARRGRFLAVGKQQLVSVDSRQIAQSSIVYRRRNEGTKAYQDKFQVPKNCNSVYSGVG